MLGATVVLLVLVAAVALASAFVHSGPAAPVAQDRPGPVVLVPGYGGLQSSLDDLLARLRGAGREAVTVRLPAGGTGDVRGQARAVAATVDAILRRSGADSVDLVGYSAGGVVARLYVRDLDGAAHVRRVVMLGSPNHGTSLATQAAVLLPGGCQDACAQLMPGSDLLDALNAGDETPAGPRWLSLWTTQDTTVVPPQSAALAGAVNVALQHVCPDERVEHGGLPHDRLVIGIVLRALGSGPLPAPTPGDCAALRNAGGG